MQGRVVALLIGAAAVLVLVVVLFFRVRSAPEAATVSPADVVTARTAGATEPSAGSSPPSFDSSATARPPSVGSEVGDGAAAGDVPFEAGSRAAAGARAAARARREAATGEGTTRSGDGEPVPPDLPADSPPEMIAKRRAVTEAYDVGDFETALRTSEEFLRFQADNPYVQRVAAVSACAIGDEATARMHHQQMDESNQRIVQVRCRKYGIAF